MENNVISFDLEDRHINIFKSDIENVPTVYCTNVFETGDLIIKDSKELGADPYNLVSITNIKWDEELSPWPHKSIISKDDNFTGQANEYLDYILNIVIPNVESEIGNSQTKIIAGYSMAGMFSLYVPYFTDIFDAIMSASGSVWYPDFVEFVKTHEFIKKPKAIYLSLGNQEIHSANKYIASTQERTEELLKYYQSLGIDSIFQINQGNHYHEPNRRMAKGLKWTLEQLNKNS